MNRPLRRRPMPGRAVRTAFLLASLGAVGSWPSHGSEPGLSCEQVCERLRAATVTVRILPAKPAAARSGPATAQEQVGGQSTVDVTVCSGISVAAGCVVTFGHPVTHRAPLDRRYRVTLPDGEQSQAALRVVDHYSGLSLLQIDKRDVPVLPLASEPPVAGQTVLTASAAGIERAVCSQGIVGGVDRSLGGAELPPLLQCDVRTTEASSGAALTDRQGRLLGVVAATSSATAAGGWTYAVPARHVQRLLDARQENQLVVLQRRRPLIGLTMGPGGKPGSVTVERVDQGGPAAQAGVKSGDVILEADGRRVRSAYQVVDLILSRQPGEQLGLLLQRGDAQHRLDVTLAPAGVAEPPPAAGLGAAELVHSQVQVRAVRAPAEPVENPVQVNKRGPVDELQMLRAQVAALDRVIGRLQAELARRDAAQAQTATELQALQQEVAELRRQLQAQPEPQR